MMIHQTIKQIHEWAGGLNDVTKVEEDSIKGVEIDSRKISSGHLFVPLKGEKVDGHEYVKSAIEKGASAALWQKAVPNPPVDFPIIIVEDTEVALQELARHYLKSVNPKVVGVTGSNGKTTTKDITASLIATTYKVHKTSGNYNNHLGLPLTILGMSSDTEVVVLEMGMSSRGEIEFLSKLAEPDIAVITNIGESHLLDLGSREEIAKAKLEIIQGLSENGSFIYYGDERLLREGAIGINRKVYTFGTAHGNDVEVQAVEQQQDSTRFQLSGALSGTYEIPILGRHNVMNAVAAMLVAKQLHISTTAICEGLASVQLTNMRMEMLDGNKGEKIINDAYNASPTSMKAAIRLVESLTGYARKIVVLGDMLELGEKEKEFHREIGESISAEKIDKVFTYGQLGQYIAEGARVSLSSDDVKDFISKEELIAELRSITMKNDLILVKASRGMRLEEVVQGLI